MARPRLDEQERRARPVSVRVTAAEAAELRERAQAARLSMGAYLRRRALGQRVRMAAELRLGAAELRQDMRQDMAQPRQRLQPAELGAYQPDWRLYLAQEQASRTGQLLAPTASQRAF